MGKKLYYKIGEACKKLEIQPYVLRYWETEFPALNPSKSKSGQRVYSSADLKIIQRIKELLYEEGFTIAGAKKKLEGETSGADDGPTETPNPGAEAPTDEVEKEPGKVSGKTGKAEVDKDAVGEVKLLRRGIEEALKEAREILDLLDSETPVN